MGNNLYQARINKKDEFYTRLVDIERELDHYKEHFIGKTIYLNCDDPYESQFFVYFVKNFHKFHIKRVIASGYHFSQPTPSNAQAIWVDYLGEPLLTNDNPFSGTADLLSAIGTHSFVGDGDFRSEESISLLKEADIVITNPPFSLFREFVAQLVKYDKKFIIIGHQNALTYKDFFPLVKEDKVWIGFGFPGSVGYFTNKYYEDYSATGKKIDGLIRVSGVTWFTNLPIDKRNSEILLEKVYNEDKHPYYDNYDAINVDKVKEIPKDYSGKMGVPITFLNKYNPNQFEIVGLDNMLEDGPKQRFKVNGKTKYARIVVVNKKTKGSETE